MSAACRWIIVILIALAPAGFFARASLGQCAPELLASFQAGDAYGIAIDGDTACVANGEAGIFFADIEDPATPRLLSVLALPGSSRHVEFRGSLVFVSAGQGGLCVIDASDPEQPVLLSVYDDLDSAGHMLFDGQRLFLRTHTGGITVLDVSDPLLPEPIGTISTPGHPGELQIDGDILYVADSSTLEVFDVSALEAVASLASVALTPSAQGVLLGDAGLVYVLTRNDGLFALDLSDFASPVLVGSIDPPGSLSDFDVRDGVAYLAGQAGLHLVDVSDPASISLIVTTSGPSPFDFTGLAISLDHVFLSNLWVGLQVFELSSPNQPAESGRLGVPQRGQDVAVHGDIAYYLDAFHGLSIFLLDEPGAPRLISSGGPGGSAVVLSESSDTLYLGGENRDLTAYDVSDPLAPTELGFLSIPMRRTIDLDVMSGLVCLAADSGGMSIVDVSNPQNMLVLSSMFLGADVIHAQFDDSLLYLGSINDDVWVFDIADPSSPQLVTNFRAPGLSMQELIVSDGVLYLIMEEDLVIYDIATPSSPVLLSNENHVRLYGGALDGDVLYLAAWPGRGVKAIDVSDPAQQIVLSSSLGGLRAMGFAIGETGTAIGAANDGFFVLDISSCSEPADLDGNGSVDAADLAILLAAWGSNSSTTDLDGSGVVDSTDLAILLAAWG